MDTFKQRKRPKDADVLSMFFTVHLTPLSLPTTPNAALRASRLDDLKATKTWARTPNEGGQMPSVVTSEQIGKCIKKKLLRAPK